jgi:periplasmic divalent cation tolerance protein
MAAIVVMTTLPHRFAQKLASELVKKKLAACVSILPKITSTYRWKQKIETSLESLLLIKTSKVKWNALQKFVLAKHPYELPELIALPVSQLTKEYAFWIKENIK